MACYNIHSREREFIVRGTQYIIHQRPASLEDVLSKGFRLEECDNLGLQKGRAPAQNGFFGLEPSLSPAFRLASPFVGLASRSVSLALAKN